MARLFDDASLEYLDYNGAVLTAAPITVSCWFNTDTDAIEQTLFTIYDDNVNNYFQLYLRGDRVGNEVGWRMRLGGGGGIANSTLGFSTNTWQHACGIERASNDRSVFLDGANEGTNAADLVPTGLDKTRIARAPRAGASYVSGSMAEVAVWNIALDDDEVAALAAGFSPLLIHPGNLVAYWPLIRDEDQDRVGGFDMTPINTPSIAPHAPVIYPAMPFVMLGSGACVTTVTVTETATVTVVAQV